MASRAAAPTVRDRRALGGGGVRGGTGPRGPGALTCRRRCVFGEGRHPEAVARQWDPKAFYPKLGDDSPVGQARRRGRARPKEGGGPLDPALPGPLPPTPPSLGPAPAGSASGCLPCPALPALGQEARPPGCFTHPAGGERQPERHPPGRGGEGVAWRTWGGGSPVRGCRRGAGGGGPRRSSGEGGLGSLWAAGAFPGQPPGGHLNQGFSPWSSIQKSEPW